MTSKHDYDHERKTTFDRVITLTEARLADGMKPAILIDLHTLTPNPSKGAADREVWSLFRNGLIHLKEGGVNGQAGMITAALTKTSLRSTALASSLGVQPPHFEPLPHAVTYKTGYEEAVFFMTRLIEAAKGDLDKSRQMIRQKIRTADPSAAFGMLSPLDDPAMKKIFDASGGQPPLPMATAEDITIMRRHMMMSLEFMSKTYVEACTQLQDDISGLTPPQNRPRPQHPSL
jgi:hypothetical protein